MKYVTVLAFVLLLTVGAAAAGSYQDKDAKTLDVSGKWAMTLEMSMGTATPALELKQEGATITGTYTGRYGASSLKGTLKGRTIQFAFEMGEGQQMSFSGEVAADGQAMKGSAVLGEMGDATWSAVRQK